MHEVFMQSFERQQFRRNTLITLPEGDAYVPAGDFHVLEAIDTPDMTPGGVVLPGGALATTAVGRIIRSGPGKQCITPEGQSVTVANRFECGQVVILNPHREVMEIYEGRNRFLVAGDSDIVGTWYTPAPLEPPAAETIVEA
jgi:co-chaperonin GroES (HSP10)